MQNACTQTCTTECRAAINRAWTSLRGPQPAAEQLLNLANRAERGPLSADEAARLRDGLTHHCARAEQAEAERDEARMWARHGYEIGQRHCGWTDHGVAPAWLTDGWPRAFDSCEYLQQLTEFDLALTRIRALAGLWQAAMRPGEQHPAALAIRAALDPQEPQP
jgi:hypothetical protein